MIEGAVASGGPNTISVGTNLVPSCFDDPSIPIAHIDFFHSNTGDIVRFEVGIDETDAAFCGWSWEGQFERRFGGLSKGESHSCRNEIVNSEAWKLFGCPLEPTN
jgi:hypothetical protein